MMIDTHCHLDREDYDNIEDVIHHMDGNYMIASGATPKGNKNVMNLIENYHNIFGTIGLHPECASNYTQTDLDYIEKNLLNDKIVGLGEIGLDYYWNTENKELQKEAFIKQIELANELELPIVIHSRDASVDTIDIIKNHKVDKAGIFHCCQLNQEMIRQALDLGYYISFAGPITFKNSKNAITVVNMVPMNKILIETDSPYLSPEPLRGKRNDSRNVKYVAQKIAEIKGISLETVANQTYSNAMKIFEIK